MSRQFVLSLVLVILAIPAVAQVKPVYTISFDKDFSALGPNGATVAATPEGKPELVPGKFGQALKSGPGTGYLRFPTTGLRPDSGTVEMWVCPLDWKPADQEFHVFFDARGDNGALYLYKYYQGVNLLMLSCSNPTGPYSSSLAPLNWQPGEWHHIAGVWSAYGVRVFADGKQVGSLMTEPQLPSKLPKTFMIGDNPWHIARKTSSLVDEVRIYDRALSPAHIAAHFAGNYDFVRPLDAKNVVLRYDLDAVTGVVTASVSTGGSDTPDAELTAQVALVTKGAPLPAEAPVLPFVRGQVTVQLSPDARKPGDFEVVAKFLQQGHPAFELRKELIVPDTTGWRGNKLGTEDKVLPPWTPVKVAGNKVDVWDREYDFKPGYQHLLTQVTSGRQPLLAGPVILSATVPGVVHSGELPMSRWSGADTRATLDGGLFPNGLHLQVTVEYDGLAKFELSGKPAEMPEALTIDIPVRPEIALYRHRFSAVWDTGKATGNLPAGEGVIDHDKFIPYYWLGNNDRGLFWMCESDEMWPNGQSPDALQVVREKDCVILRLNLLTKGQKLPDNWKFVFALQATPVKPTPADWRKWRMLPGRGANINILWPGPGRNSIRYFGYPQASDPALYSQTIQKLHEAKTLAVPYLCLSFISAACPEWPFFRKCWAMGPVDSSSSDVAAYGAGFAMASPVGKDYSDFIVWKTAEFIKQYHIDGLYHDNTHPYSSTNLDAGCGYTRGGKKVCQTFPILGFRDLYRRMYSVMKAIKPDSFTMAHMSGKMTIPILAYDDSYLDGEHFRGVVKDSYMDVMSLDTFRAEFMGRQWGIMPFFLPEFDQEHAAQVEPTRGLMALLMLHDVAPWPIWCNTKVMNEALAALDDFGYVDSTFIGYYENIPPAVTNMKDVYISAYKRLDTRTLLVVANVSKEDREGEVTINGARLRGTVKQVVNWPGKEPMEVREGKVNLSVPRLGYRLLLVQ